MVCSIFSSPNFAASKNDSVASGQFKNSQIYFSHFHNKIIPKMMSWLWFRTIFAAAALIYFCTVLVGILGNFWVVASVLRTTKKGGGHCGAGNGLPSIRPSDRLRKYIWLLAVLDLLVSSSLVYRLWALVMPDQQICEWRFCEK